MEIEIKIRLASDQAHKQVLALLRGVGGGGSNNTVSLGVHEQTNYFLDGQSLPLRSTKTTVFRLRETKTRPSHEMRHDEEGLGSTTYTATIKRPLPGQGGSMIEPGLSHVQELESTLPPGMGEGLMARYKQAPHAPLLFVKSEKGGEVKDQTEHYLTDPVLAEMRHVHPEPLWVMASFSNTRHLFSWCITAQEIALSGGESIEVDTSSVALPLQVVIEVDETRFAFGTAYEIEVETVHPALVKRVLCAWLDRAGIPWSLSRTSKFKTMLNGRID